MEKSTRKIGASRKGRPNKTTKELKDMILGALDKAGGEEYLAKQALMNPSAFMSLIGKVLPRDISAKVSNADGTPINFPSRIEIVGVRPDGSN